MVTWCSCSACARCEGGAVSRVAQLMLCLNPNSVHGLVQLEMAACCTRHPHGLHLGWLCWGTSSCMQAWHVLCSEDCMYRAACMCPCMSEDQCVDMTLESDWQFHECCITMLSSIK